MQVLCKFYKLDVTGIYDPVYSTVHLMKYLESDVMLYKWYRGLFLYHKVNEFTMHSLGWFKQSIIGWWWRLGDKTMQSPHKLLCLLYQDYCDLTADSGFTTSAPKKQKRWVPHPGSSPPPNQRKEGSKIPQSQTSVTKSNNMILFLHYVVCCCNWLECHQARSSPRHGVKKGYILKRCTVWSPFDHCLITVWSLFDHHLITVWSSFDHCWITVWSFDHHSITGFTEHLRVRWYPIWACAAASREVLWTFYETQFSSLYNYVIACKNASRCHSHCWSREWCEGHIIKNTKTKVCV